jgi:UPF0716 protein FxsA
MFKILFLLFLVVPIIEISILIQLSDVIGGWPTILLVILTAYFGAQMVKQQGLQTIAQIQQKAGRGQIPGVELFSGVCILISGVLLLTPGILTDVLGFLLLTPVVRVRMAEVLKKKIHLFGANAAGQQSGQQPGQGPFTFTSSHFNSHDNGPFSPQQPNIDSANDDEHSNRPASDASETNNIIDGEFKRKD